jgi:hypothetical protein
MMPATEVQPRLEALHLIAARLALELRQDQAGLLGTDRAQAATLRAVVARMVLDLAAEVRNRREVNRVACQSGACLNLIFPFG